MSCDRDFGLIEKAKRRNQQLFTLMDVAQTIGAAGIKNPFGIMIKKDFIDWKSIASTCFKKVNDLRISEAVQIEISRENFPKVEIAYSYDEKWSSKSLLKKGKHKRLLRLNLYNIFNIYYTIVIIFL